VLRTLHEKGLRSYCWLPLTTAQKRLGTLGLGSSQTNAYGERDMRLLPRVAKLVAVAVENALTREALVREKERLHVAGSKQHAGHQPRPAEAFSSNIRVYSQDDPL
jgi:formate hydrogenlyase transcriptional activator